MTGVRSGEDATDAIARSGRAGHGGTPVQTDDLVTQSTAPPGHPSGRRTRISPDHDESVRRSLELENSAADIIAGRGYRIQQNPSRQEVAQAREAAGDIGDPEKNPDYLIEGRVFDCYSPTNPTKNVRGIWWEVEDKIVVRQQAQRAVVNLEDWTGDLTALQKQFRDWPIPRLKEVKAILPNGEIVQVELPPYTD